MVKIGVGIATILCFILPMDFGQSDLELFELLGELTFVDYDRGRIAVLAVDGKEAVFDISDETEIVYVDPETEDEESMELEDLEPGFTVLVRYNIQEDDTHLAHIIEIRSLGLGNGSWIGEPLQPEPPVRVAGVPLQTNEAMLFLTPTKSRLREDK